jgi:hypothetical protein
VEQVDDITWVGCIAPKASEEVGLCFVDCHKNTSPCRYLLRQQLAELPQLHQAGYWIVSEILLSERRNTDQCVIVPV